MLLELRAVLTPDEVAAGRRLLDAGPWSDGRVTAGEQAMLSKRNEQLPETCDAARQVQQLVLRGLERNAEFFSATLPRHIAPPLFNRYSGDTNTFGDHVDAAIRFLPGGAMRVRTDVSCTLFFSEPDEYDGGELVIEEASGITRRVKLRAGDMVVYPGTSVHRVEPVTRGARVASFFWIQSMVRSQEQRRLLFDMDNRLRDLRSRLGDADPAIVGLTGTYHNLLRHWADV